MESGRGRKVNSRMKRNLIGFTFLDISLFGDVCLNDDLLDIHYETNASSIF